MSVFQFTAADYPDGIFWPLYCLSFSLQLLITPLVSFGHCIVCLSVYSCWLPRWYLLVIVKCHRGNQKPQENERQTIQWPKDTIGVIRSCKLKDRQYNGQSWPLYCLSFSLQLLTTPLVSFGLCIVYLSVYGFWLPRWYLLVIVLSVFQFTASDYPVGIFWPLYCLSFSLQLLITPMVSFGHCIVCLSTMAKRYQRGNQQL
jgi:uncharacterized membrane protein